MKMITNTGGQPKAKQGKKVENVKEKRKKFDFIQKFCDFHIDLVAPEHNENSCVYPL